MTELEKMKLKKKEDAIYHNLLYSCRVSLGDTHERAEIEECMKYVYPEYLRRKARILAYDFGEIESYEEGDEQKSPKKNGNLISRFLILFFSLVFLVSTVSIILIVFFIM